MSLLSFLNRCLRPLGLELRRPERPPETEARKAMALVRPFTMLSEGRLLSLYDQVVHCETRGVGGSYVECGTWKGGATGLMAAANLRAGRERRHLHLFDSFVGIPEPDAKLDGARAVDEVRKVGGGTDGKLVPIAGYYETYASGLGTAEDCRKVIESIVGYDPSFVHYHAGWFQETLPKLGADFGPIAILRIDADWHASTKVCLEHLYDRVVPGGFVIIDDYGYYEGCRKAVDEFLDARGLRVYLNDIDGCGRYWIKP